MTDSLQAILLTKTEMVGHRTTQNGYADDDATMAFNLF